MRHLRLFFACLPVIAALFVAAPAWAVPDLQSMTLDPDHVQAGGASTGTVMLSEPATNDTTIQLAANPANGVSIPPTVTVLTGQTHATFPVTDNLMSSRRSRS